MDPIIFDASMQSAIASLQSNPVNRSSSAQPVIIENSDPTEDQESAAYIEALIKKVLNVDSDLSGDKDDSGDEDDRPESTYGSSTTQPEPTHHTARNLDTLAIIAPTAPLLSAPSIPDVPVPTPPCPSYTPTTTSSTVRPSKCKATQTDYTDLDENGELDAPTPKKHRAVTKVANKPKAGNRIKKQNSCRSTA